MGTSNSFGGSGSRDARDLRDNIAGWLKNNEERDPSPDDTEQPDSAQRPTDPTQLVPPTRPQIDLKPVLGMLLRPRGSGGGDGPGGGGGAGGSPGRQAGGPGGVSRSASRVSKTAGRAGSIARAYASGDAAALQQAGLDYHELRSLKDPIAVGAKIMEVAFDTPDDGALETAEERDVAAEVVTWILEYPEGSPPSPEEIVRKTIECTIISSALTEIVSKVYDKKAPFEQRRALEQQIKDMAEEYAAQASLGPTGATEQEISQAIEVGLRDIGRIYGVES